MSSLNTTDVNVNSFLPVTTAPPGSMIVTSTAPDVCAGVTQKKCFASMKITPVGATPPNLIVEPVTKFTPVIVTLVPPDERPREFDREMMCPAMYVKAADRVLLSPLGFVTTRSTMPSAPAGALHVIEVELTHTTLVAATPLMVTVAPFTKRMPVIVSAVPPET